MPRVPTYDQQVKPRETQAPAPIRADPVQGAFGADVGAATAKLGDQISRTAEVVQGRLLEMRKQDDDQEVLDRYTSFQQDLQGTLHNQDQDANGMPTGLLDRQLGQVKDLTPQFDDKMKVLQKKYTDSVAGPDQKENLGRLLAAHSISAREQVISHESQQRNISFDQTMEAVKVGAINQAASTPDPAALGVLLQTNSDAVRHNLEHYKLPPGVDGKEGPVDIAVRDFSGKVVKSAFDAVLEQNPKQAKTILDTFGDRMLGDQRRELQQKLDGKLLYDEQAGIYQKVSGLKTADGFPDAARMDAEVRKLPLPEHRIEQIADYVKGRAGEDRQAVTRGRETLDRQFTNDITQARKDGSPMDAAMRFVPAASYDATDRAAKEAYVQKLYSGPHETDPTQFIGLWEGIQNRIVNRKDIDNAFLTGYLKPSDWESLRKEHFRMAESGDSPEDKDVRDRVKVFAEQNIPNKKDRDTFLYTWQDTTRGMPPAQKFTYSQDLMKGHDSGHWWMPNTAEYKVQMQGIDADRTETGALYKMVGQDEVNAIARGVMLKSGKQKWGVQDINDFAKPFGGPDKILPGTPVHNAIQSLNRHGKMVTPETVQKALGYRADGKF